MPDDLDPVWKALSDPTRRAILDLLRQSPRRTTEIVDAFPHLTRFGVMKHIEVLRDTGLIVTREERRPHPPDLRALGEPLHGLLGGQTAPPAGRRGGGEIERGIAYAGYFAQSRNRKVVPERCL
jgi:DNA-binding transcriptional ArsR family regulator